MYKSVSTAEDTKPPGEEVRWVPAHLVSRLNPPYCCQQQNSHVLRCCVREHSQTDLCVIVSAIQMQKRTIYHTHTQSQHADTITFTHAHTHRLHVHTDIFIALHEGKRDYRDECWMLSTIFPPCWTFCSLFQVPTNLHLHT